MPMQNEGLFLGHRHLVAIEAIDDDRSHAVILYALTDPMGKFAGGKFSRVDLLDD
jgi:hypothetical protein